MCKEIKKPSAAVLPENKDATLVLKLKSDSGYRSEESHRVSPMQWMQIQQILKGGA